MVPASLSEFSLIEQYFAELTFPREDVSLGIGDDCALLQCHPDKQLAVSIDTLVAGVHFFEDVDAFSLGYKSLAVGLSDLAAMGAEPAWFTLALTLPEANSQWLQQFSQGLAAMAAESGIQLVGGDTTRGPLTISIQVHGWVSLSQALRRDCARVGDVIFVSGTLGDAGAALQARLGQLDVSSLSVEDRQFILQRLQQPQPRTQLGLQLAGMAHAGIDISDGLLADLTHITQKSRVGAHLELSRLPLSSALKKLDHRQAQLLALTAGDDYELCFTVDAACAKDVEQRFAGLVTRIGLITQEKQILAVDEIGQLVDLNRLKAGYDHFNG